MVPGEINTMLGLWLCLVVLGTWHLVAGQNPVPDPENKGRSCNVTGLWRSDMGSVLMLMAVGPEVKGVYRTAVELKSGSAGPDRAAKITGMVSEGSQPTVAFAVLWPKGSCSAWVGQCFVLPVGGQVLKTLWLLRSVAENPSVNWESTRLGEDQFIFVGDKETMAINS